MSRGCPLGSRVLEEDDPCGTHNDHPLLFPRFDVQTGKTKLLIRLLK